MIGVFICYCEPNHSSTMKSAVEKIQSGHRDIAAWRLEEMIRGEIK